MGGPSAIVCGVAYDLSGLMPPGEILGGGRGNDPSSSCSDGGANDVLSGKSTMGYFGSCSSKTTRSLAGMAFDEEKRSQARSWRFNLKRSCECRVRK